MALQDNLDEKSINTLAPERGLLPPAGKQKEYSIAAACIFESAKSQIVLRSYEHSRKANRSILTRYSKDSDDGLVA